MNVLCICPEQVAQERAVRHRVNGLRYWSPERSPDALRGVRYDVLIVTIGLTRQQWQVVLAHCTTPDTLIINGNLWTPEDMPGYSLRP